ncbi:hypothetical protein CFOL_v3_28404, partial [Cephalotus follicularis]
NINSRKCFTKLFMDALS